MEVKTRRSKFKCKKKVSNKQALAQATKEVKLISEWFGESIRIARDAVMAIKAMEDWLHKLPHEVQKVVHRSRLGFWANCCTPQTKTWQIHRSDSATEARDSVTNLSENSLMSVTKSTFDEI